MKKLLFSICFIISLIFLLLLTACSNSSVSYDIGNSSQYNSTHVSTSDTNSINSGNNVNSANSKVVEETEYYKIVRDNFMYHYYIFDKNHNVVKSEGPTNKYPKISMVDEYLLRFTYQAGAGILTRWGYYYDVENNIFSEIFYGIYDQSNGKVAYGKSDRVVVRDIFDKNKYYQEISSFKEGFSYSVEPITDAEFVNDATSINITYLAGSDYKIVTETFCLD